MVLGSETAPFLSVTSPRTKSEEWNFIKHKHKNLHYIFKVSLLLKQIKVSEPVTILT